MNIPNLFTFVLESEGRNAWISYTSSIFYTIMYFWCSVRQLPRVFVNTFTSYTQTKNVQTHVHVTPIQYVLLCGHYPALGVVLSLAIIIFCRDVLYSCRIYRKARSNSEIAGQSLLVLEIVFLKLHV